MSSKSASIKESSFGLNNCLMTKWPSYACVKWWEIVTMLHLIVGTAYALFAIGFLLGSLWGRWSVAEKMAEDISLAEEELLSFAQPKSETAKSTTVAKKEKPIEPLHILLASPNDQEMMEAFNALGNLGHEVTLVQNGKDVTDCYHRKAIDLVVLTLAMPLVNGIQATMKIRDFEAMMDKHTPIIGMGSKMDDELRQRCFDAGMDGLWERPLPIKELLELINGEDEKPQEEETPTASEQGLLTFNPKEALSHLNGNETLLKQIAEAFLREMPTRLENIKTAINSQNRITLHEAAHSLKGAASCLAAGRVFCSAHRLSELVDHSKVNEAKTVLPNLEAEMTRLRLRLSKYLDQGLAA